MQARPAALALGRCSPVCASSANIYALPTARQLTLAAAAAAITTMQVQHLARLRSASLHTSATHASQDSSSRSTLQQQSSGGAQRANEPPLPPPNAPPPKVMRSLSQAQAASASNQTAKAVRAAQPQPSSSPSAPEAAVSATPAESSSSPSQATASTTPSSPTKTDVAPQNSTSQATSSAVSPGSSSSSLPSDPASSTDAPAEKVTLWSRANGAYQTLKFLFLFYLHGVKQIFRNRTRVLEIQARVKEGGRALSREEYQLVKYHNSDMRKLPLFLAIVLILEELLPLVVIYAPGLLPSTCILPSQIAKIREKDEVRRTEAVQRLRAKEGGLVAGQGTEASAGGWDEEAKRVIGALDAAALKDLSVTFKLPTWGGSMLQRGRLASHLVYLRSDDALMAGSSSGSGTAVADEVPQDVEGLQRACTERGLRTSGVDSLTMSEALRRWLSVTQPRHGTQPSALDVLALPLKLYDESSKHATTPVSSSSGSDGASSGGVFAEAKAVAREVVEAEREIQEREKRAEEEVRRKEAELKESEQSPATAAPTAGTTATTSATSARP
ncbi:unnamed protein product [Tilletia controversa]|nr:unnamed protein product [Tilletia controversa]CAD6912038.1 unnamed protein product [Tilletia caries]